MRSTLLMADKDSERLGTMSRDTQSEKQSLKYASVVPGVVVVGQSCVPFGPLHVFMVDLEPSFIQHGGPEMGWLTALSGGCLGGWPMDLHRKLSASDNQRARAD